MGGCERVVGESMVERRSSAPYLNDVRTRHVLSTGLSIRDSQSETMTFCRFWVLDSRLRAVGPRKPAGWVVSSSLNLNMTRHHKTILICRYDDS